jgi:hypothetical protein
MTRHTRSEVEQILLRGSALSWQDGNSRKTIHLNSDNARRLFEFVLKSNVREAKGLSQSFINGLWAAYDAGADPATALARAAPAASSPGPWRLTRMESYGFGGLNSWQGPTFTCDLGGESLLLDGANGSGKSSIVAAIAWALTGHRPRDVTGAAGAHDRSKVFNPAGKAIGDWPPLATYPTNVAALKSQPEVRVKLTFRNDAGTEASIERLLRNDQIFETRDPNLDLPGPLIETGVMMPIRLNHIRFGTSEGPLVEAVQMLTGLDEIVAVGDLVAELCHKSREYLGYARTRRRDDEEASFRSAIQQAKDAVKPLERTIPDFTPKDTEDDGSLAKLSAEFNKGATDLLEVIKADLASTIDLGKIDGQRKVAVSIDQARRDLASGLDGLPAISTIREIETAITESAAVSLDRAIRVAIAQVEDALRLHEIAAADSRFRLKALGAALHVQHAAGPVEACPLCEQSLREKPELAHQLDDLRTAGEAAQRTFADNASVICRMLEQAIPKPVQGFRHVISQLSPKSDYAGAVRQRFILGETYQDCLAGVAAAVEAALDSIPEAELPPAPTIDLQGQPEGARQVHEGIAIAERFVAVGKWARENHEAWRKWWGVLAGVGQTPSPQGTLAEKLDRLDEAAKASEPYRSAATALGQALQYGKNLLQIDMEQHRRQTIADTLDQLKALRNFVEVEARNAIDGLSARMGNLLADIHIVERLQFQSAHLDKKTGVTVRGGFDSSMRIDATLVANTSWLRALLWSFVFSVRQEAVEQLGGDTLPFIVLDDPQATFDMTHRFRWAKHIASMQAASTPVQVILATHDESFLEDISVAKVRGRMALLVPVGTDNGCVQVLEGGALERGWIEAKRLGTQQAAQDYIANVRVYAEAILKAMVRGEVDTRGLVLGDLRERIKRWHEQKISPWNRAQFRDLAGLLDKSRPEIHHIESAHHASGRNLGMAEAVAVEKIWAKDLRTKLEKCFRAIREHRLLHGGSKALYADPPSVPALPGYRDAVKTIPMTLFGRAAALTGGRIADGTLDMTEFAQYERTPVVLGHHDAYRLIASTLEPVARSGDILLVAAAGEVPPGSLVVAICGDQLLARRIQFASDHPDVAVLIAQAVNPRDIAPPVIAHISTIVLHKIVGVLFDPAGFQPAAGSHEVADCGGAAAITGLVSGSFGLVEVTGNSAEPQALHGQYLLVRNPLSPVDACRRLNGQPVIASDSRDVRYFKRLRVVAGGAVVLESLDASGTHEPILLAPPGSVDLTLGQVWPVAGVLFERPN